MKPIDESARVSSMPLSSLQKEIWVNQLLHPNVPLFNVGGYACIKGALDITLFKQALSHVINMHEALRIRLHEIDEHPQQTISAPNLTEQSLTNHATPLLTIKDFTGQESAALQWIQQHHSRPFSLYDNALCHFSLCKIAEDHYYWYTKYHYLIADGQTLALVIQDVSASYNALLNKGTLPAKPPGYDHYIVADQAYRTSEQYAEDHHYWRDKYQQLPDPLLFAQHGDQFEQDEVIPSKRTTLTFSEDLFARLDEFSETENVSVGDVLLAVLYTYFAHINQQDDCVIGMINLSHREITCQNSSFDRTAGFFLNVIPLRCMVDVNKSFINLLKDVKRQLSEDSMHARLTLGEINREAKVNREDHQRSQLFELELAYIDFDCDVTFGTAPLRFNFLTHGFEQYALTVYVERFHKGGNVDVHFDYNCTYLNAAEMALLSDRFEYLLEQVLQQPGQRLSELALMPAGERHQVLQEFNTTNQDADYGTNCIHQLFEAQVESTPNALAVMFDGHHLSYHELNKQANQLGHHLQALGVKPNTLVGICVERSLEMIIGLLGILKAGGAYVPLDPAYPQERLAFMLSDTDVSVLLTQQKWLTTLTDYQGRVFCLDNDWEQVAALSMDNPLGDVAKDNLAYVIYTSGSTGKPKGVMIRHEGLCNLAMEHGRCYDIDANSRVVQFISLSFDPATADIFTTLCLGAALYLPPSAKQALEAGLVQFMREHSITHMQIPPAVLASLPTDTPLPALQVIGSGGEAPNPHIVQQWAQGRRYFNLYGPTEITISATIMEYQEGMNRFPIGKPIANTQIYILDNNLQPTPIGVVGEMYIGGIGVAQGYLNRPKLTAERFVSNPFSADPQSRLYKTGDLVRYLTDGNIEFIGREDNQIKIRGFRVELGEIEQAISQQPDIRDSVVVLHKSASHDKRLVAYLAVDTDCESVTDQLRESLKKNLPEHMIPAAFVVLDTLPLTPNGKVDRHVLENYDVDYQSITTFSAPRNDQERQLAHYWMQVLGLEEIGIHHNFFELGGDSLSGIQLITVLQQSFNQSFQLADLFRYPTIAEFAERLKTTKAIDSQIITAASEGQDLLPLSFSQEDIWLNDKHKKNDTSYNICTAFSLNGPLLPTLLQRCFNEIMQRHSILRTHFMEHEGQARQIVNENANLAFETIQAGNLSESEQREELVRLLSLEEARPFSLEEAPLWRVRLVHFSADKHALIVCFHHSIEDAWSIHILLNELSALYVDFKTEKASSLEPLNLQYSDFAIWQRNYYTTKVLQKRQYYWQKLLSDPPPQLNLPTDFSSARPPEQQQVRQTYDSGMETYVLSEKITQQLRDLGKQHGCSLSVVLLSAYFTLLYQYGEQRDLVVGMPTTKRNQHQVKPLIGYFSGMSVLRVKLPVNASFLDVLVLVKNAVQQTMENQDLTLKQVWNALQLPWTGKENLLFRTVFNFIPVPREAVEMADITIEPLGLKREKMVRDLVFGLWDKDGSGQALEGFIRYRKDLFAAATIQQMVQAFQDLLAAIIDRPKSMINTLVISEHFRKKLPGASE